MISMVTCVAALNASPAYLRYLKDGGNKSSKTIIGMIKCFIGQRVDQMFCRSGVAGDSVL
ncbi:hypothetical protein SYK_00060 [Pseudodesulfovibrio nedwellii]|uniref:IS110 family transposase n=1 Tax=Pseudodesulfovibrio nedwellii TaxID=2973072 RepID=A0ABM8AWL6_9BACT|nr:hypothetical protein SYK_00060 [Pseudodesulfovibrio nedwellii]